MFRKFNNFIWVIIMIGVLALVFDSGESNTFFVSLYTLSLEFYLLGISAFFVFKRVLFYRLEGEASVIRLIRNSEHQSQLIGQGIILSLLYLLYLYYYRELMSFDSILIAILLLYYLSQVFQNSVPTIYIDNRSFSYDDYFVEDWEWQGVEEIEIKEGILTLTDANKEFKLDFDLIDEVDYYALSQEVERGILDGEFAKDKSSKGLLEVVKNYATKNGVKFIQLKTTK